MIPAIGIHSTYATHADIGYVGVCCGAYVFNEDDFIKYLAGIGYCVTKRAEQFDIFNREDYNYVVVPLNDGWFIHIKELHTRETTQKIHPDRYSLGLVKYTDHPAGIKQLRMEAIPNFSVQTTKEAIGSGKFCVANWSKGNSTYPIDTFRSLGEVVYESPEWVWNHNYLSEGYTPRLKTAIIKVN